MLYRGPHAGCAGGRRSQANRGRKHGVDDRAVQSTTRRQSLEPEIEQGELALGVCRPVLNPHRREPTTDAHRWSPAGKSGSGEGSRGRQGQGPAHAPRRTGPGLESGDGPAHHRLGRRAAPDPLPDRRAGWLRRPASCSAWERSGRRRPARSPTGCTRWPSAIGRRTRCTPTTSSSCPGLRFRRKPPGSRPACRSRRASDSPPEKPRDTTTCLIVRGIWCSKNPRLRCAAAETSEFLK